MICCFRKTSVTLWFSLVMVLLTSCAAPIGNSHDDEAASLRTRLAAANLVAGSLAEGFNRALHSKDSLPGNDQTQLIEQTLHAVEYALDGAAIALRSGLDDLASRQITAAESQIDNLQLLVPIVQSGEVIGEMP